MTKYYLIHAEDVDDPPFILRTLDRRVDRYLPRSSYTDLVCSECGKISELAALLRGIEQSNLLDYDEDVFRSYDDFYIISEKSKRVFDSIEGLELNCFTIPEQPRFYVAMPRIVLNVDSSDAFTVLGQCKSCLRPREAGWGPGIPQIPSGLVLGMYPFETRLGIAPDWVADSRVVNLLKRSGLKGWIFEEL